jgi:TolB-like protein
MQERVAILNTLDDSDSISISESAYLTDRLRETAANVLPKSLYGIMTTESIVAFLGSYESMVKECRAASCLAELGRKVNADYVAQGRIRKFGELLSINFELYNTKSGVLVGSFNGNSKDVHGFVAIIDEKAPALFMNIESQKMHQINLITEPSGAILSFNGESSASCPQTPCKTELREGDVRIIATLERYETADTTVSINAGSQFIAMRLKPNIIVYEEAKPAKTSHTMVAVALDIAGVVLVSAGLMANANMQNALDRYGKIEKDPAYYEDTWKDVQNSRSNRNMLYVIGGLVLASGVGVHIWF